MLLDIVTRPWTHIACHHNIICNSNSSSSSSIGILLLRRQTATIILPINITLLLMRFRRINNNNTIIMGTRMEVGEIHINNSIGTSMHKMWAKIWYQKASTQDCPKQPLI
jgi:hypothetical protein